VPQDDRAQTRSGCFSLHAARRALETTVSAANRDGDGRGGVVWHTQGSGKSLTMAFLARRLHMHPDPELNRFTLLVVTDRRHLEPIPKTYEPSESERKIR
jgi:type I site-specific restriction-modification system R (restriction) subunit